MLLFTLSSYFISLEQAHLLVQHEVTWHGHEHCEHKNRMHVRLSDRSDLAYSLPSFFVFLSPQPSSPSLTLLIGKLSHINTTLIANMSSGNNPVNSRAKGPANTPANNQANGTANTSANTSANGPANIPLRTRTDIPTVTMDTAKVQGALILLHMDNPSAVRRLYVGPQDVLPLVHYGEAAHTLTTLADPATAPTSGQCTGCNEQKCFTCGRCGCLNFQSGTVYAPTSFCRNDQSDPMSAQTRSRCEGCNQQKCLTCGHCGCRNNQ